MALIKCPECGKDLSDKVFFCIHCGYPIKDSTDNEHEQNIIQLNNEELISTTEEQLPLAQVENRENIIDTNTEKYTNSSSLKIGVFTLLVIIIIITSCYIINKIIENNNQQEIADLIIEYYNDDNYLKAWDYLRSLDDKKKLGDSYDKVIFMGEVGERIYEVDRLKKDDDISKMSAIESTDWIFAINDLLCWTCGNYSEAEKIGCGDKLFDVMKEYAQLYANYGFNTVEKSLYFALEDSERNELFEPLITENEQELRLLIDQLNASVDYEIAEDIHDQYILDINNRNKEEYDTANPIQITNDDYTAEMKGDYWYCKGTVHNISNTTYYYVKLKVTYMDKDKTVLTTDWTYAVGSEGIKGGENQQFEIMTKVTGNIRYYKCEILEWN